jgi:ATP-dependent Clp protease ATP-binding subunit ClpC
MENKLPNYFSWHFIDVPQEVIVGWRNFLAFNFHFFSTKLLIKTLFSPWKRIVMKKDRPGFRLEEWFTVVSFNLISRCIGAFLRLTLIVWALLFEIVILVFGLFFLFFCLIVPVVSLPTYLSTVLPKSKWRRLVSEVGRQPKEFALEFVKSQRGIFLFNRMGVDPSEIEKSLLALEVQEPLPQTFSTGAGISETFINLCQNWIALKQLVEAKALRIEDLVEVLAWYDREKEKERQGRRFWAKEKLLRTPALASNWQFGYTVNLDQYACDLTPKQSFAGNLIGRDEIVSRMETIFCRSAQSNVILVGQEGVGKRTVVFQLANNIREGKIYPPLKHKRVLEVNVNKIVGEGKTAIEAQNLFEDIIEEASGAGNIILVIPRIDRFVSSGEDRLDLTPVLEKYLGSDRIQILGITTPDFYQKYIYPNATIAKYFNKVEVEPPAKQDAIRILESFAYGFEKGKKVLITFPAIREAVEKSDRYITDIPFPEKAIDLLDETVVHVASKGGVMVTTKAIAEVLSLKTKVPVGDISRAEADKLIDLEAIMHRRLVGQEEAISALSDAFRRTRLQLGRRKKPAGVFLFLGPTGVGKTETAKALAEAYFGSEERLVRLDMNEYQDEGASVRLLGSFDKNEPGILIKLLRDNPFCVLLFDEIEKASKQVLNLFLAAFDEGYITDNFGKQVSLREMVIIATSNAGAEFIRQKITRGERVDDFKSELIDHLLKESYFSPELLNRFDSVVVYKPLTPENLIKIAELMLKGLNDRLKERGLSIKITESLLKSVAQQGFDPVFGARPMNRLIQDKIEAPLAKRILTGEVGQGEIEVSL